MLIFGMEVPLGYTIDVVKLKLKNNLHQKLLHFHAHADAHAGGIAIALCSSNRRANNHKWPAQDEEFNVLILWCISHHITVKNYLM